MKEKIKGLDKRKLVGIAAIIMAAFLVVVFATIFWGDGEPAKENKDAAANIETEDPPAVTEDIDQSPIPEGEGVIGEEDVDRDSVHIEVRLLPEMEDEIPDMNALHKAIEDYIVENDLWVDVTRAQTDFVITKDYNKNTVQLEFLLDDRKETHIVVLIKKNTGDIALNHY